MITELKFVLFYLLQRHALGVSALYTIVCVALFTPLADFYIAQLLLGTVLTQSAEATHNKVQYGL
jgi:hypothetical protein